MSGGRVRLEWQLNIQGGPQVGVRLSFKSASRFLSLIALHFKSYFSSWYLASNVKSFEIHGLERKKIVIIVHPLLVYPVILKF